MAEQLTPGTAPVTDQRTPPRGVLPRGAQTWLMAALAFGSLAIIVVTGRPEPAVRPATTPPAASAAANRMASLTTPKKVLVKAPARVAAR